MKNFQKGKTMDDKMMGALTDKINELLTRYNELREDNKKLRDELVRARAENEAKSTEIERLENELKSRNIESEDIAKKIEAVLGK